MEKRSPKEKAPIHKRLDQQVRARDCTSEVPLYALVARRKPLLPCPLERLCEAVLERLELLFSVQPSRRIEAEPCALLSGGVVSHRSSRIENPVYQSRKDVWHEIAVDIIWVSTSRAGAFRVGVLMLPCARTDRLRKWLWFGHVFQPSFQTAPPVRIQRVMIKDDGEGG